MVARVAGIAVLLFLSCACKRTGLACLARVRELRERTVAIDWSTINLDAKVSYADIPGGEGMARSGNSLPDGDWIAPVIVDGSVVWYSNRSHDDDASLDEWLTDQGSYFHDEQFRWPFYVLATHGTRVGLIRRVEKILRPLGGVRLAVRPATIVEPWPPRANRKTFYAHKTRTVPPAEYRERVEELVRSISLPAKGCPEAEKLAERPSMSPGERLRRIPDAFEKCSCKGDMDTTAALLWFMALENQVPIRWHPWDEELVRSMGDDATYAELAKVLTERYLAARQR
jgi:hypothetical protein